MTVSRPAACSILGSLKRISWNWLSSELLQHIEARDALPNWTLKLRHCNRRQDSKLQIDCAAVCSAEAMTRKRVISSSECQPLEMPECQLIIVTLSGLSELSTFWNCLELLSNLDFPITFSKRARSWSWCLQFSFVATRIFTTLQKSTLSLPRLN